jgi:hypothetical protein
MRIINYDPFKLGVTLSTIEPYLHEKPADVWRLCKANIVIQLRNGAEVSGRVGGVWARAAFRRLSNWRQQSMRLAILLKDSTTYSATGGWGFGHFKEDDAATSFQLSADKWLTIGRSSRGAKRPV